MKIKYNVVIIIVCISMIMFITSCGILIPNTMNITFKNKYAIDDMEYTYSIIVNSQITTERSIAYNKEEQYTINWWRVENKKLRFEIRTDRINDRAQSDVYKEKFITDIRNFQKITVTFTPDANNGLYTIKKE